MLPGEDGLIRTAWAALEAPYRRWEPRVRHVAGVVWACWALRGADLGHHVTVMGPLDAELNGHVSIGARVYFLPGVLTTRLNVASRARLEIGASCGFAPGACVCAHERVRLGAGCLVASQVVIEDAPGAPVTIGDGVWLAHGSRVGPGVTIGKGSAVSAGTVVTKDVPEGHLAIGAPARHVKLATLERLRGPAAPRGNIARSDSTR